MGLPDTIGVVHKSGPRESVVITDRPKIYQSPGGGDLGLFFNHILLQTSEGSGQPQNRDPLSSLPTEGYCRAWPDKCCCCCCYGPQIGRKHAGLDLCHQPCDQSVHQALQSVAQELTFMISVCKLLHARLGDSKELSPCLSTQ